MATININIFGNINWFGSTLSPTDIMPTTTPISIDHSDHHLSDKSSSAAFEGSQDVDPGDPNWTWVQTLFAIPLCLIILGTLLGNSLVIYCFITKPRHLRNPTHYFIANLAVTDFGVGLFVMPYLATLTLTLKWYFGSAFCLMWTMTHFSFCGSSILSTMAVCIERYIGVRYPLQHREIMTKKRIFLMIGSVWAMSEFLMLTSLFIWTDEPSNDEYDCPINRRKEHVMLATVLTLYVPALIMGILYWRIYSIATTHSSKVLKKKSVPSVTSEGTKSTGNISEHGSDTVFNNKEGVEAPSTVDDTELANIKTKKQINLAKRLSLLVCILVMSYGPVFTLNMLLAFHPDLIRPQTFLAVGWIRYFNSCINPFIYAYAVPAYRKEMHGVLFKVFRRK